MLIFKNYNYKIGKYMQYKYKYKKNIKKIKRF